MGFLTGGLFYDMIGKTGNNVGRRVNGRNVVSMAPARGNRTPSEAQLVPQLKFKLITEFYSQVTPFLRVGFEDHAPGLSAWNAAVSYNVQHAITGVYPALSIDYTKMVFSKGKLAKASGLVIAVSADAQLDFSWSAQIPDFWAGGDTDKLAVLVYNPAKQEWVVSVGDAVRSALSYDLAVPSAWSGDVVFPYVSFISADGKVSGTTQFLTSVEVM